MHDQWPARLPGGCAVISEDRSKTLCCEPRKIPWLATHSYMKIKLFSFITVVLFVLLVAQPAFAHGDEPRLEISPEKLSPGAVLDVRGVDFEFEEQVALTLHGEQSEIPFGTILADVEGVFVLALTLPFDLPEGTYILRATTDDHTVESPQIAVSGAPIMEGGGQGERDEDDALLAPMPTYAPGVSSTPMPQAEAVASTESTPTRNSSNMFMLWGIAGVAILLVFAYIRIKRK